MVIPQAVRQVLEGPALGHFVTLDADGSPQVTCVWVGLDGDELVVGSLGLFRKIRNISVIREWRSPLRRPSATRSA